MCEDCWEPYTPTPITPEIKTAVAWLFALYNHHSTGGWLHVWVDDWNLPVPASKPDWIDRDPDEVERPCWEALKTLTEDEQATALAVFDGYYLPDSAISHLHLRNGLWGEEKYWTPEVEDAIGREACTILKGNR